MGCAEVLWGVTQRPTPTFSLSKLPPRVARATSCVSAAGGGVGSPGHPAEQGGLWGPGVRMEHPPADARAAPSASAPRRRNVRATQRRTTG
eukprot:scaffold7712_cov119-Isochrysis_galbana.AAC.16